MLIKLESQQRILAMAQDPLFEHLLVLQEGGLVTSVVSTSEGVKALPPTQLKNCNGTATEFHLSVSPYPNPSWMIHCGNTCWFSGGDTSGLPITPPKNVIGARLFADRWGLLTEQGPWAASQWDHLPSQIARPLLRRPLTWSSTWNNDNGRVSFASPKGENWVWTQEEAKAPIKLWKASWPREGLKIQLHSEIPVPSCIYEDGSSQEGRLLDAHPYLPICAIRSPSTVLFHHARKGQITLLPARRRSWAWSRFGVLWSRFHRVFEDAWGRRIYATTTATQLEVVEVGEEP